MSKTKGKKKKELSQTPRAVYLRKKRREERFRIFVEDATTCRDEKGPMTMLYDQTVKQALDDTKYVVRAFASLAEALNQDSYVWIRKSYYVLHISQELTPDYIAPDNLQELSDIVSVDGEVHIGIYPITDALMSTAMWPE